MQVKKMKQRDDALDKAFNILDKKTLNDNVNTLNEVSQISKTLKAVSVARAADFFTHLRRLWGDWDKIRRRILTIMGKYLESEEEKRMNYLKRKLLQWKENAKQLTKEVAMNRIAKWAQDYYKLATAKKNWKDLLMMKKQSFIRLKMMNTN